MLFGLSVYYALPIALLSANLSLLLFIFFFILLGMIMGLTLLAANFQGVCEMAVTYVFLFWESKMMRTLVLKNLSTHKDRNSLTAIIFSLTLGCIIFLIVSS